MYKFLKLSWRWKTEKKEEEEEKEKEKEKGQCAYFRDPWWSTPTRRDCHPWVLLSSWRADPDWSPRAPSVSSWRMPWVRSWTTMACPPLQSRLLRLHSSPSLCLSPSVRLYLCLCLCPLCPCVSLWVKLFLFCGSPKNVKNRTNKPKEFRFRERCSNKKQATRMPTTRAGTFFLFLEFKSLLYGLFGNDDARNKRWWRWCNVRSEQMSRNEARD